MQTQVEKVFERFMVTDLGRRLLAESEQEAIDIGKREKAMAELLELKRSRTEAVHAVQTAANDAHREVKTAQEAVKLAIAKAGEADTKVFSVTWGIDQKIREAEFYLMASAPSELKTALENAELRLKRLREKPIEKVTFPDIPEAYGLSEKDRPTTSAVQERVQELNVIETEIAQIQERILTGGL